MTLLKKLVVAGPWVQWIPVAVIAGLFAWVISSTVRDTGQRVLYLRLALLVVAMGLTFVFDDTSAETTDATPSRLLLRRVYRLAIGLIPWALLVVVVLWAGSQEIILDLPGWEPETEEPEILPPIPHWPMALEGATMAAVGVVIAGLFARKWADRPGRFASVTLLGLFAATWVLPRDNQPWIDPFSEKWLTAEPWWWMTLGLALIATGVLSWDTRRR